MEQSPPHFNVHYYIDQLRQDLQWAYIRSKQVTTPGLKGDARENAVRDTLSHCIPDGVGVGTGCVIDCENRVSQQIDVVLYEKAFCPVFSINGINYFPCEFVIAVGEIKSIMAKKDLVDVYEKIKSVRQLNKFAGTEKKNGVVTYRHYLSLEPKTTCGDYPSFRDCNSSTQIYGFGLCEKFKAKPKTVKKHALELCNRFEDIYRPNVVVSLDDMGIMPSEGSQSSYTSLGSDGVRIAGENIFHYLVTSLLRHIFAGKTALPYMIEKYTISKPINIIVP